MRGGKNANAGLFGLIVLVGIPLFLLMEHPWVFWCVFVPLVLILVIAMVKWITTGGLQIQYIIIALGALFAIMVVTLVTSVSEKCEHENMATMYSFSSYDSTAYSDVRPYCRDCGERFQYQLFKGELVDKSYLSAIVEHSDGSEIVPGEYYTITAIVTLTDYDSVDEPNINCKVENEGYKVIFNVEFREEFAEAVSYKSLEEGDTITFRGRFYDEGCGFTDSELLNHKGENE